MVCLLPEEILFFKKKTLWEGKQLFPFPCQCYIPEIAKIHLKITPWVPIYESARSKFRTIFRSAKISQTFCPESLYQMTSTNASTSPRQNVRNCLALLNPTQVFSSKRPYSLRKHAYSNKLKILPPKNVEFQIKSPDIFHISAQNIDCGYSLEPPRWGGSNEYPQSMSLSRNKKNNVYPCKPQFYYIKVGFKGVQII